MTEKEFQKLGSRIPLQRTDNPESVVSAIHFTVCGFGLRELFGGEVGMNRVVIGVGSNIDPEKNIVEVKQKIGSRYRILAEFQFVETKPEGCLDQPDFVNGAILIETEMDSDELKDWLGDIEKALGRVRSENKYGSRTIDLDIVVRNGKIVEGDFYKRDFLRNAVLEVWPSLIT